MLTAGEPFVVRSLEAALDDVEQARPGQQGRRPRALWGGGDATGGRPRGPAFTHRSTKGRPCSSPSPRSSASARRVTSRAPVCDSRSRAASAARSASPRSRRIRAYPCGSKPNLLRSREACASAIRHVSTGAFVPGIGGAIIASTVISVMYANTASATASARAHAAAADANAGILM